MEHWIGCIAGALDVNDYRSKLERAGFELLHPARQLLARDEHLPDAVVAHRDAV